MRASSTTTPGATVSSVGRFATAGVTDVVAGGAMTAVAGGARNFHAYAATATSTKRTNATNAFAPAKTLRPTVFTATDDAAAHVEATSAGGAASSDVAERYAASEADGATTPRRANSPR